VGLGLLNLVAVILVISLSQSALHKHLPTAGPALLALFCLAAYIAAVKWIERRNPAELAARRALPEAAIGIAGGFLLFCALMAVLFVMGVYHPAGWGRPSGFAAGLFFALLAGITEEILFRGLLFRLTAKIAGTWGALLLTSAVFGLAHAANPGATFRSSLAIALEAGMLLGAAYAATQRLWLPIGLHVGWNFTEGSVFGMSISGGSASAGMLQGSLAGPPLLTGGAFGPEASLVAVLLCFAASLFLLWRAVKLHRVQPAIWSSRAAQLEAA